MSSPKLSRRSVALVLGGTAIAAPALLRSMAGGESEATLGVHALLAPLGEGSRVGRWTLVSIGAIERGAAEIVLATDAGLHVIVDLLARDPSPRAPRPPALTVRYALHVRNGGDGAHPTDEEAGLAAMALAEIVKRNEAAVEARGLLSFRERLEFHKDALLGG